MGCACPPPTSGARSPLSCAMPLLSLNPAPQSAGMDEELWGKINRNSRKSLLGGTTGSSPSLALTLTLTPALTLTLTLTPALTLILTPASALTLPRGQEGLLERVRHAEGEQTAGDGQHSRRRQGGGGEEQVRGDAGRLKYGARRSRVMRSGSNMGPGGQGEGGAQWAWT